MHTALTIRRLLIDLEAPVARHWCGGDAFSTALLNALSMSFPVGEQFFIDAVRAGVQAMPVERQAAWQEEIKGFIGQEATHRRIHTLFNAQLARQGLVDEWTPRVVERQKLLEGVDPRHAIALTAATEHFTAMMGEWLLAHPEVLAGAEPRLQTLWLWHSAEECEHKHAAFELYQALDGDHAWRVRWFRRVTVSFLLDVARQTLANLRRDGTLWRGSTWRSAARLLFGRQGLVRANIAAWRDYLRPDFHPNQHASALSARWLAANQGQYAAVGAG
jgi:predicted metal-dependent hydrolase